MIKRLLSIIIVMSMAFASINYTSVDAASVKLNKTFTFVRLGTPVKLKVNNTKKKVKWKCSDKKVATVSKKGVVKGKKDGSCYVTAKVGGKKLKCHCVVTHKIANKITKATMKKIAKAMKKKGTYNSKEKCYVYRKRIQDDGFASVVLLKYYPKKKQISVNYNDELMDLTTDFKVGDKQYCSFSGTSYEHQIYAKGRVNKKNVSKEAGAVLIDDSNIAPEYKYVAKEYIYKYFFYEIYLLEKSLVQMKTNVYSEDLGFKWPRSVFENDN